MDYFRKQCCASAVSSKFCSLNSVYESCVREKDQILRHERDESARSALVMRELVARMQTTGMCQKWSDRLRRKA